MDAGPLEAADGQAGGELYRRIVESLREAISTDEVALIVGIHPRQVQNWAAGRNKPTGNNRELLLEAHYVVQQLRDIYQPEGVEIWLHSRNRELGSERPLDLLVAGDFKRVLAAVDRLHDGSPT